MRDLEADFRRFFGLPASEVWQMHSAEFFSLATRVVAYDGVMAARIQREREEREKAEKAEREHPGIPQGARWVEATDPALAGMIE